jgi:mercuric ion transport protein
MTRRAVQLYAVLAWLFVGCVVAQIFLAGLGVFNSAADFRTHTEFGYLFGWLTLGLLAVALAARLERRLVVAALALLILFALQSLFVAVRGGAPFVAALHPLNGFLILLVGIVAARDSSRLARLARRPGGEPSQLGSINPVLQAEEKAQ